MVPSEMATIHVTEVIQAIALDIQILALFSRECSIGNLFRHLLARISWCITCKIDVKHFVSYGQSPYNVESGVLMLTAAITTLSNTICIVP